MAVVLAGLLFSMSASAAIINPPCGEVPIQQLTYTTTTQIDKFDATLGTAPIRHNNRKGLWPPGQFT